MRRIDILKKYQLSNFAFDRLLSLGVITCAAPRQYEAPWNNLQLFRPRDVANWLSRYNGQHWNTDQVIYKFKDLFFDLHQGECNRSLLRITLNDFRSLVKSVNPSLLERFDTTIKIAVE